ncbi:2-oxoglutarate dehydrogenase E1 component [Paraliobacillus quinghaiensis]|uniref:2-oxoglutarate dehydrogenase E1 component n=1 Tax=Paraliobacillus quinghaiensis TaxID=470815 RepID=A0A917TKY4_9BACI|nr:2-oxoglutarate dehydrogenase E1 component [Paraliobacillus quinghaiensis]GGM26018.1 2-oxoglutarate dehydrogenase E1 component [Paraliobacillus quinghaiensis]
MTEKESNRGFWHTIHDANKGYIEEQYRMYLQQSETVQNSVRDLFERYGPPIWTTNQESEHNQDNVSLNTIKKVTKAIRFIDAIRRSGHLAANIYPIQMKQEQDNTLIDEATYGLTVADLKNIPASFIWEESPNHLKTAWDIVKELKQQYSSTISFEYDHVNNEVEKSWLQDQIESGTYKAYLSNDEQKDLLKLLVDVEEFERFLAKTFVAQKRFSIEGLDVLVPMLQYLVQQTLYDNTDNVLIGMAHRGRLNVLTHILDKPFDRLLSEFYHAQGKVLMPSSPTDSTIGWTGDVKYHFGTKRHIENGNNATKVTLGHNPSHLEFVNPVVQGFTRACQDMRYQSGYPIQNQDKACSILIHGDAAFTGQGVVAETLNLSGLTGYQTGGTIHIIANNQIGFTTNYNQSRSTQYPSDLAKGFEIPIIHVNADDPEACLSAMKMAYAYRKKFNKDFLIDLVGYRRYGHNEMDEPRATQPTLYREIDQHPSVTKIYAEKLLDESVIPKSKLSQLQKGASHHFQSIYFNMIQNNNTNQEQNVAPTALKNDLYKSDTAVSFDLLHTLNQESLIRPANFSAFKKIEGIFKRRAQVFEEKQRVDWSSAEFLAFGSILADGISIRLTGQDTERGAFAHRHLVLHDINSEKTYSPLHGLSSSRASFDIHNSPLSEIAALGFEYGYSVQASKTLVIWEAQFGDFMNVGQVMFDEFITAGRAKWGEKSNMVILLPHGYEGQGPDHSSGRLERFLTAAAENNMIIANVTTSAQYFHLLRRQATLLDSDAARPLIVMTPKSLLRHEAITSEVFALSDGEFQTCLEQDVDKGNPKQVKRIVIGTGKVMVDLAELMKEKADNTDYTWLRAIRLEQIYPFHENKIQDLLTDFQNIEEIVWIQEEPENMGAWRFVKDKIHQLLPEKVKLRYVGRCERSSPAEGDLTSHQKEQKRIIQTALELTQSETNSYVSIVK